MIPLRGDGQEFVHIVGGVPTGLPIRSSASDQLIIRRGVTSPAKGLHQLLIHGNCLIPHPSSVAPAHLSCQACSRRSIVGLLRPEIGPDVSRCVHRLVPTTDRERAPSSKG
jgi:hypothetical protein